MAMIVGEVDDYGSTQEGLLLVPLAMTNHNYTNSNNPTLSMNRKMFVFGIIGLAAVVASGTSLFYSIMDSSSVQAKSESSLLNDGGGDKTCVPASGPWPRGSVSLNDDAGDNSPYATCFSLMKNGAPIGYCWSKSYKDYWGNWQPCTPNGFERDGVQWWEFAPLQGHNTLNDSLGLIVFETCGTACTGFSKDMPS
ncbi:hypothetical protein FRACYDRAFT_240782 [Fragilariopsis cylindrus CCMP1102]|uniref:Uncharacterized protein n=1 Tax=Fragilariopsis cylindrus CCMP1102 TaxID=635003 RepID=A0A1E7F7Y9_9STRA|nr:hypothetical protein FRACYDRAFT_240782 [Fragilariopsis cylindrus CCMP1102]|eukprot:OEU14249.1 hypothetical protein FRACYDRAFT_240782 [Fragilariopsis cylindrus CCMP1102]